MQMTISELSREYGLCRHAILYPIHQKRLKAKKHYGKWFIDKDDYEEYRKGRFKQERLNSQGKPLYDKKKGYYSVKEASEIIGCHLHRVYFHARTGAIPSKKVKSHWMIHIDDINDYKSKIVKKSVSANGRTKFERLFV